MPVCVIEICRGFCCEHISEGFIRDSGVKLPLQPIDDNDNFRCLHHDKVSGLCGIYEKRPLQCRLFFCDSAERGFMAKAKDVLAKEARP